LILGTLFPAHDDHNPSLHVSDNRGKPLVKCHAGCSQEVVINALRARGLWAKKTGAAEGIESAASVQQLVNFPCVAVLSADNFLAAGNVLCSDLILAG
jgi:hypothetical protein